MNNANEHAWDQFFASNPQDAAPIKKPPRIYSLREKILLPIAFLIAILFDRIVIVGFLQFEELGLVLGIFWLSYLIIFCIFFRQKVRRDAVAWIVAACAAALCLWRLIFPWQNWQFDMINWLVLPAVLVAHAQWVAHGFTLKNSEGIAVAWLLGWVIAPFSGIFALFGAANSFLSAGKKSVAKRAAAGAAIALSLLVIIIPLLMSADQVFAHYIRQIFMGGGFGGGVNFIRLLIVMSAFCLFYSFFWNVGHGDNRPITMQSNVGIDKLIANIVLSSVIFVYILFCAVQFTYLFARAGLPAGMTYSEYAREGFAQTVFVCALNLLIFGVFLRFKNAQSKNRGLTPLLCGLLGTTGIMLASGAVRLNLYISTFGMTWLRLLSAWFIIYLAVVIILCVVRLFLKKPLPLAPICAILLLIWYVALGYLNPDGFIHWFNYDFRV